MYVQLWWSIENEEWEVEKAIGVASASGNVLNVRNISLIGNPDRSRAGLGTQILGSTDCTDF